MTEREITKRLEKVWLFQNLKYCAHITLGVDNACDKVFREAEQRIGVHNLISVKFGEKAFTSSGSTIHTLGEIAISTLLSPSHAAHSVSLYSEFVQWMEQEGIERQDFKDFTANRFGRIAQIANQFLKMKDQVLKFFDSVVDINSNKLVLAVSVYIQSDRFSLCCELYRKIADLVIFPLIDLLGIYERGKISRMSETGKVCEISLSYNYQKLMTFVDN